MKRGLKGVLHSDADRPWRVAEYSPMKRGLKDTFALGWTGLLGRCRVFPDEEGTESVNVTVSAVGGGIVAEYSPMKRGLKA